MNEDLIRYDILTQDALRTMIAKLLDEVSRTGLPGEHHFFITFDTSAPGVKLSTRMKEKYPDEMTIVVQHRFWDLEVTRDAFQIGLSFDDIPELLVIPLAAIKGFYDPSVKFGLQFEVQTENEMIPQTDLASKPEAPAKNIKQPKNKPELFEEPLDPSETADTAGQDDSKNTGADVVSLDSFRKKK